MSGTKQTEQKKTEVTQKPQEQAAPKGKNLPEQENKALPTKITVRAYPRSDSGNVLAGLTLNINDCFAIRGASLMQGKNGPFVSMPQRQTRSGYQELIFPITKEMREIVNNLAVSAYQLAMKEMTQRMEQAQNGQPATSAAPEMSM